ncbi:hypothetical protein PIB30_050688 [Stylosanthes scabra]|uniref:Uncharacterized protein n=1 Tax=Stylosanthes scabra TaxID=79078 RepID=A0ABU6RHR0_9FABA|nr:hypothetical protein [Stylosanthes scabra]
MPSGAKKRKAAKKKKEKQSTNSNNLQGIDESKSQDDRGSDGSSPAYHDHEDDHQHPFKEGNEEEAAEVVVEANFSAAQPSEEVVPTRDIKIDEAVGREGEFGDVKERELKAEEDLEIGDGNDVEAKELDDENGKAGASSNAEAVGEKNLRDDLDSSLKETFTYDDGDRIDVEVKSTKELDYENGKASGGNSNAEAVGEKNLRDDDDTSTKETVTNDELVESIDSSHAKMTSMAEDAPACVASNSVLESSIGSAKSAGTLSEVNNCENGKALQEKTIASQVGETEFGMKRKEDDRASNFVEPKPKEFKNEVLSREVTIPLPKSTNGTYVNDSETPECSENQPLPASAPRMVQKTSWLNCCGLFEVLSGSER